MDTIPILHCFDHNYVLQAGVCFHSLLSHTSPTRHYVLHVMATGLTAEDKDLLQGIVGHFRNATLVFDNPPKLDLPDLKGGNFSKALFYKLALANLYPQYDRAIVSDVDVVYADDIALAYDVLPVDSSAYLAGPLDVTYASWRGEGILRDLGAPKSLRRYFSNFSAEERSQLRVGAGFMTFNLRRMREEQIPDRCFSFAKKNFKRLVLPEQDVLNLICGEDIVFYPPRMMAIASYATRYHSMTPAEKEDNPAWEAMFSHPVQIHYATGIKPWKYPASPMADLWFNALLDSGLFARWRTWIDNELNGEKNFLKRKRLFQWRIPLGKRRTLSFELTKETRHS